MCIRDRFSVAGPEKINIVYDCGSLTSVSFVEHQIKYNFQEDEVIHAVFLSHLDADHINGLPYLLKYCNVKKIFFPLLTEMCIRDRSWSAARILVRG